MESGFGFWASRCWEIAPTDYLHYTGNSFYCGGAKSVKAVITQWDEKKQTLACDRDRAIEQQDLVRAPFALTGNGTWKAEKC